MEYNHKDIEKKWQNIWEEKGIYNTDINSDKEKVYLLIEFPYPSGDGLHVGHVKSYTAMDIVARKKRAEGKEVLYPIGWDAFGLPAENYAIKTGIHPSIVVKKNIDNFRKQLKACGLSFDWNREVDTTDPSFYKWSQWIFLKLYENGLAYKKKMPVNWCPKDKCVLANEEVVDGCCERCGTPATKRDKDQWMLAITKYAERLDKDLDDTTYLPKIKAQQRNWIGMSEGSEIEFFINAPGLGTESKKFSIFTTRADTIFGCTYCVLAPEHPLVQELLDGNNIMLNKEGVQQYILQSKLKKDFDRSAEGKEKTGVRLDGVTAINPASGEELPLFIADYVLPNYGTGAIMAVPAHDERDYAFAKKYNLEIRKVILTKEEYLYCLDAEKLAQETEGGMRNSYLDAIRGCHEDIEIINSEDGYVNTYTYGPYGENNFSKQSEKHKQIDRELGEYCESSLAKKIITEAVGGKVVKKSKLRDWVFARQRYWGEPIPIVYDENNVMYPVAESEFPITLPMVDKFEPTDNGESPLALAPEWVYVYGGLDANGHFVSCKKEDCEHNDCKKFRRETDTMPQWAGSSWYFMRYIDTHNDKAIGDRDLLAKWLPVDWYNGGMEHTTLHLLYSRFWYKFLYDIGVVPTSEPYYKRTSQGMILGAGGVKMSKTLGNVINPDVAIEKYGADTLRLYEMFMGPFDQAIAWDDKAILGPRRFLERAYRLIEGEISDLKKEKKEASVESVYAGMSSFMHMTCKIVLEGIETMSFNTGVSQMMIALNALEKEKANNAMKRSDVNAFIRLLALFAPHIGEELYAMWGGVESIHTQSLPTWDEAMMIEDEIVYALQVNGKLRDTFVVHKDDAQEMVEQKAKATTAYEKYVGKAEPKKVIIIKGKLVNVVM